MRGKTRKKQMETSDCYVKGKGEGGQAICYQALQGVVKPFVTRRHIGLGELKMCFARNSESCGSQPFFSIRFLHFFHIFSRSEKSWGDKITLRRRRWRRRRQQQTTTNTTDNHNSPSGFFQNPRANYLTSLKSNSNVLYILKQDYW